MNSDVLESRIFAFEQDWSHIRPSEVHDLLDRPPALNGPVRFELLVELICIDLEFRWRGRAGGLLGRNAPMLENYVARFPQLGPLDELGIELIGQEYRVRRQWGDQPSHDAFLSRFPSRRDLIRSELIAVDRELCEESPRIEPAGSSHLELENDPSLDLMSHHEIIIRRMIGAGSMGKVYEAWRRDAGRTVAVKFLRKALLREPGHVERFLREAATVARLGHPNIVKLEGLGRAPGGSYFMVMERVAGANLDASLRAGPIPWRQALGWMSQVCDGLGHAHARGIVHCDLKPANLLLDAEGTVRLTDFGLARVLNEPPSWATGIEGTAPFMAPEQASRAWGRIDARTDIYGVGAVLFTLLTGRAPYLGRCLADILPQVASARPVTSLRTLRPDLPDPVDRLCLKCLEKEPRNRFQSTRELREAIPACLAGSVSRPSQQGQ